MVKRIKIIVTKDDIYNGEPAVYYSCPISLAYNRCVKDGHAFTGNFSLRDRLQFFILPKSAERFVSRFDRGLKVKPFSFFLSRCA